MPHPPHAAPRRLELTRGAPGRAPRRRSSAAPRALARRLLPLLAVLAVFAPRAAAGQGSGGVNRPEHLDAPYVVLVSFDGFRHDYLDRFETPNFDRLAREGARADALIPVFPTKTFPNHYSIATGMYAENHGLVANTMYDPELDVVYSMGRRAEVENGRWYGGEPIWVTAERQGMVSASFFWVGTEAPIQGVRPTIYKIYDGAFPYEARVDSVLAWLRLPPERRPHLVSLYFSEVDHQGHDHGPDSPQVEEAVRAMDRIMGRLLDGLAALPVADRVHVVVVSDHGMQAADRHIYLEDSVSLDGVRVLEAGPYAALLFDDPAREAEVVAALRAGLAHARVYPREELPPEFRYARNRRIPDVIVLAEPGWLVGTRERLEGSGVGHHGYDPRLPAMHGIFLAAGPAIRGGTRIPAFENVHVYPLLARILGLEPYAGVNGRLEVLGPILKEDAAKAAPPGR